MKILLIEDDKSKHNAVVSHLKSKGVHDKDIIHAWSMTDFAASLDEDIGLFIIDFNIPYIDGGDPYQNGKAILETILKKGKNKALLLAISSYPEDFSDLRQFYEKHGCILSDFKNTESWKSTLDHLLIQLNRNQRFDFIIFCALRKERNPYVTLIDNGKQVTRDGMDCHDIKIGEISGTVILLPAMGLVNAAIIAGRCIDRYNPTLVGMSGVCGGFEGRAKIGQLFVSKMAYEYQSGKWVSDGFQEEPYQAQTDATTLTDLDVLTNEDGLLSDLQEGFPGSLPTISGSPSMGIFTSGSAVIADEKYMQQISNIHRKVNVLDMEVYAILRAAELAPISPSCICAKTVVDMGNKEKADDLHIYGSYISAKYLIKAIRNFYTKRNTD